MMISGKGGLIEHRRRFTKKGAWIVTDCGLKQTVAIVSVALHLPIVSQRDKLSGVLIIKDASSYHFRIVFDYPIVIY